MDEPKGDLGLAELWLGGRGICSLRYRYDATKYPFAMLESELTSLSTQALFFP